VSTPSSPPELKRRRHRKGQRSKGRLQTLARVWRNWWVEILVAFLVASAVFLLVEQMNIRATLFAWLLALLDRLGSWGGSLVEGVKRFVRNTTLSDLTAYGLLVIVLGLVAWRTRWRLMTSPRLTTQKCPVCDGEVHRIRRRTRDRLLSVFVPVRRYRCRNRECNWQGLRVQRSRFE
jgi:hypothetical protein